MPPKASPQKLAGGNKTAKKAENKVAKIVDSKTAKMAGTETAAGKAESKTAGKAESKTARKGSRRLTEPAIEGPLKRVFGTVKPNVRTLTNSQWHWTMKRDVCGLVEEEYATILDGAGRPVEQEPIDDREVAFKLLAERYLRYIVTVKAFDECYKFLVHPQKRILLFNCTEGILARILELKQEMVEIEQREFHFFDDILQTLSLTPDQTELPVLELYSDLRAKTFRNRELILESILERRRSHMEVQSTLSDEDIYVLPWQDAILLIQRMQRAFIARRKRQTLMRRYNERMLLQKSEVHGITLILLMSKLRHKYVDKWKAFVERKRNEKRLHNEMIFLGMIPKPRFHIITANQASVNEIIFRKKRVAFEFEEKYLNDRAILEERMMESDGPQIAEDLKYNMLQWLLETRDLLGKFPPFPEEEKGGSALLFSNKTVEEVEEDINEMLNPTKGKDNDKKKKEQKKKGKKKKDKKKKNGDDFSWKMPESKSLPVLRQVAETYADYWYYRDETCNIEQSHDYAKMKEEARLEVAERIRLEVDNTIRQELENLTRVVDLAKKKKGQGGNKKKGKKQGRKKKNRGKDLTEDKTIEELYEELVTQNIIKKSEHSRIADFIGSHSFVGCSMQESGRQPMPSLADVRQLIIEQIIVPLGSSSVHQRAPLNRSFLLAGMRESGKHMLLNAICYEAGANLFDLTPENLVGKYDDKEGRKMLMHLIMKVGKALEPSIFLVDHCETMFLKKKVKGDLVKPHKWEKILRKTIKKIKNGDRMMLIGITNSPAKAKVARMSKSFNRTILVPRPDYGNRRALWHYFITKYVGPEHFPESDLTTLTAVSNGYSAGAIKQVCMEVLSARRVAAVQRGFRLRTQELIKRLAVSDPIYVQEEKAFLGWYDKTPLAKKRLKRLELTGPKRRKGRGKKKSKANKKKKN